MVEYNEENVNKAVNSLGKDLDGFWNEELPEDHPFRKLFEEDEAPTE